MSRKTPTTRIYVAGPLGFSEAGRAFYYQALIPAVQSLGYEAIDPWSISGVTKDADDVPKPGGHVPSERQIEAWRSSNAWTGAENVKAIESADGLVAILDGADIDSGTAAEIGFAFAKGLPILGYRGDLRLRAENPAATVNIQVEYFIFESGGCIVRSISELPTALARMLQGRERARARHS